MKTSELLKARLWVGKLMKHYPELETLEEALEKINDELQEVIKETARQIDEDIKTPYMQKLRARSLADEELRAKIDRMEGRSQ